MTTSITSLTMQDLLVNAAWARRLALNLLSDRDSADDLVQETWIAALRARPDASQSLRPWLARVLRNHVASHSRDDSRRVARHDRAADLVEAATGADPEALLGRMQVQRLLAELITGLREPARQTVLLRYYEGLTSDQIGEVMGVAPGTVRRRLKEAIDELRDELDRRHQGNRDTWLLALLPLGAPLEPSDFEPPPAGPGGNVSSGSAAEPSSLPPVSTFASAPRAALTSRPTLLRPAGISLSRIAIGTLTVSLAVGGLLLAWPWLRSQPPGGRGAAVSAPAGNGRGGAPWLAAALPGTFAQCRETLAARRKELAAAEAVYLGRAPKDVLFETGTANPTARAALLPEIERIVRDDGDAGLSFSLECRTWACRVLVLRPGPEPVGGVEPLLSDIPHDPAMRQRLRGWWYLPKNRTRDPVSGAAYTESPIHLALKKSSGAPLAGLPPALDPAPDARPEPRTLQACQSELQAAGERLAYIRRVNEDRMSLIERFRESEFDAVLTMDIRILAIRVLKAAGETRTPDVVCRAGLPGVGPGQTTSDPWRHKLVRDPAFSSRISDTTVTAEALILGIHLPHPGRENPAMTGLQLGKDILQAADLPTCATRSPAAAGDLYISLMFPDTRKAPGPGAPPHTISVRLDGPLAGTPLGRCVEQAVTRAAAAATPLADSSAGSIRFLRTFPLDAAAGK